MWPAKEFSESLAALEACVGCSSSWPERNISHLELIFSPLSRITSARLFKKPVGCTQNKIPVYAKLAIPSCLRSTTPARQPAGNIFSVEVKGIEHLAKNGVLERFKSLRPGWRAPSLLFPPDHSYGPVPGAIQHKLQNRGALLPFPSHPSCQRSSPTSRFAPAESFWPWNLSLGLACAPHIWLPGQKTWCKPGPKPSSTMAALLLLMLTFQTEVLVYLICLGLLQFHSNTAQWERKMHKYWLNLGVWWRVEMMGVKCKRDIF